MSNAQKVSALIPSVVGPLGNALCVAIEQAGKVNEDLAGIMPLVECRARSTIPGGADFLFILSVQVLEPGAAEQPPARYDA